ncbi:hypothetical protein [Solemya velum gill symbiont]|nr:hypothetical protein [Solemya velum gill symbiont]
MTPFAPTRLFALGKFVGDAEVDNVAEKLAAHPHEKQNHDTTGSDIDDVK